MRRFNPALATLVVALTSGAIAHGEIHQLNDRISWEITDSVLRIHGTGDMPDFNSHKTPWTHQSIGLAVREIIVDEGITKIGDYSFANPSYGAQSQRVIDMDRNTEAGTSSLTNVDQGQIGCLNNVRRVHLPASLEKIGAYALQGLNISYINIPENVISIGPLAFNLSGVRYIKIPAGLKKLNYSAFESCVNLECIDFSGAEIKLPKGALFDCEQLYQVLNSQNIKSVHELAVDASPLAKVNDIIPYLKAPNIDRYLGANMMPWGEFVEKFLPEPPKMTKEDKDELNRELRAWKRRNRDYYSEVLEREFVDSIYVEIATRNSDLGDNAEYLNNHKIISARYESDQQKVYEEYFEFLAKANSILLGLDEFTLGEYDPDSSTYTIGSAHHGSFRVMVPQAMSGEFADNWASVRKSATGKYVRTADNVRLRNAIFTTPDGKIYAGAPI